MIVRDRPSPLRLFFVMQGSIVPRILPSIAFFAALAVVALMLDDRIGQMPHISLPAMGVFGIALSLFLGFRNNAAYDRWWEARRLWGSLIADCRNLTREAGLFAPEARDLVSTLMVAFLHLHRGALRGVDATPEAAEWVGPDAARRLAARANPADAALSAISAELAALSRKGALDGFARRALAERLAALAAAQAGAERIATTPLPFVYSLLVRRTNWLYCLLLPFALIDTAGGFAPVFSAVVAYVFFGLSAVTEELDHPFGDGANALPLDAMCRTVERTVAEALGRDVPPPRQPVNHVLT